MCPADIVVHMGDDGRPAAHWDVRSVLGACLGVTFLGHGRFECDRATVGDDGMVRCTLGVSGTHM